MTDRIVIIGAGHVGSHVGSALLARGLCGELAYIDTDQGKARAQADDLQDMASFTRRSVRVWAGDYRDLAGAGLAVVCASGPICKEDRLEELAESVKVMDQILPGLGGSGFSGILSRAWRLFRVSDSSSGFSSPSTASSSAASAK